MGGGLMQLVAYGAQDIYLTGNPQITYFKVVYRRHTNFAIESIEQPFTGNTGFGGNPTVTIARNGDLMYWTDLRIQLPSVTPTAGKNFRWLNWFMHTLVQEVKLEIGGQEIDKIYGEWMHIWNELTQAMGQQSNYANLVGNVPKLVQPSTSTKPGVELYLPLTFFFCRNPGLALPLIALQYHEVKISFKFREKSACYWSENGTEVNAPDFTASLWVDYIFLDTDERRKFAQVSHEYLIEQLQFTGDQGITSTSSSVSLTLNHPVKFLAWVVQKDDHVNANKMQSAGGPQYQNYTDKIDTTNFTGTPSHPLGEGLGGSAYSGLNPSLAMPYGGTTATPNSGALQNSNRAVANSLMNANGNDVDLDNLTFQDLFGNGNTTNPVGWNTDLPVFDAGQNPVVTAKLQLNGQDRFTERTGRYFNHLQPYKHFPNGPAVGINVYSFALDPVEHQPSGTCNFSRIDKATLNLRVTDATLKDENATNQQDTQAKLRLYAVNYNILRIMSGMGGLAYAN
jgi:hypothetical protein